MLKAADVSQAGGATVAHARARRWACLGVGVLAGVVAAALGWWREAALVGWDFAALTFVGLIGTTVLRFDSDETARHASAEDPGRATADTLLLLSSIISLVAVGFVLFEAGDRHGAAKIALVALAVVSVVVSWLTVHLVFTLRYARLFFDDSHGGIDFNADQPGEGDPTYIDFAYVAFTIGMTFQVSDTNLKTKELRAAALHHALVSYFFGAVILSMAINLLASLGSSK